MSSSDTTSRGVPLDVSPLPTGRSRLRRLGPFAAVVSLFSILYLIQSHMDERFGAYRGTEEVLYVDDGKVLRKLTLGFENLAADLYWLRTVQYFGGQRLMVTNKNYELLDPLLRITTDLDPSFKIAYTYGSTFLSEPFPMGASTPLKGIELVDRGIENHPDYWRFYLDKGFIYFWYLKDCEKAAETFLAGSEIEGAPYWMVATASRALTGCGDRETARSLWNILFETAGTEQQRDNAKTHLLQLDALDQMDVLRQVLQNYERETGLAATSWDDLIAARYLNRVPLDPTGAPYVLDAQNRDVTLSEQTKLGGLPTMR